MNILIMSDVEAGGEWIATQTLIETVKKYRADVNFFLVTWHGNRSLLNSTLFKRITFVKKNEFNKPLKFYRQLFFDWISTYQVVADLSKSHKCEYAIITDYLFSLPCLLANRKMGYFFYFLGIRCNYRIFKDTFNHFLVFNKILEFFAWIFSIGIICPSENARNQLRDQMLFIGSKKYFYIPNLIRDPFLAKPSNFQIKKMKEKLGAKKNKIILYSGRLTKKKGVENLIKAFLNLSKKHKDILLVMAYLDFNNEYTPSEINKITRGSNKIALYKNVDVNKLASIYKISNIFILPSDFEISPIVFYESLATELPFFSTPVGDISDTLTPNNPAISLPFILKDNEVKTIYASLENTLKNYKMVHKLFSAYSRKFRIEYPERVSRTIRIFNQLTNAKIRNSS